MYADVALRQTMLAAGKISFRTCTTTARMPASYILLLARASYPPIPSDEPQSFHEAFDYWLLCELLCAIGGHNML